MTSSGRLSAGIETYNASPDGCSPFVMVRLTPSRSIAFWGDVPAARSSAWFGVAGSSVQYDGSCFPGYAATVDHPSSTSILFNYAKRSLATPGSCDNSGGGWNGFRGSSGGVGPPPAGVDSITGKRIDDTRALFTWQDDSDSSASSGPPTYNRLSRNYAVVVQANTDGSVAVGTVVHWVGGGTYHPGLAVLSPTLAVWLAPNPFGNGTVGQALQISGVTLTAVGSPVLLTSTNITDIDAIGLDSGRVVFVGTCTDDTTTVYTFARLTGGYHVYSSLHWGTLSVSSDGSTMALLGSGLLVSSGNGVRGGTLGGVGNPLAATNQGGYLGFPDGPDVQLLQLGSSFAFIYTAYLGIQSPGGANHTYVCSALATFTVSGNVVTLLNDVFIANPQPTSFGVNMLTPANSSLHNLYGLGAAAIDASSFVVVTDRYFNDNPYAISVSTWSVAPDGSISLLDEALNPSRWPDQAKTGLTGLGLPAKWFINMPWAAICADGSVVFAGNWDQGTTPPSNYSLPNRDSIPYSGTGFAGMFTFTIMSGVLTARTGPVRLSRVRSL